jgi:hypothetical protein
MGGAGGIAELDDDDRKLGFLLKAGVDGLRLAENMVAREVVKLAGDEALVYDLIYNDWCMTCMFRIDYSLFVVTARRQ